PSLYHCFFQESEYRDGPVRICSETVSEDQALPLPSQSYHHTVLLQRTTVHLNPTTSSFPRIAPDGAAMAILPSTASAIAALLLLVPDWPAHM
ncbi:unnamed protein product, partial [Ectocarpus sp. 12 AP-2014]